MKDWAPVIALLGQTLGAVLLDRILVWRLLWLVFAGRDGEIDAGECIMRDVYLAKLSKAIWSEYWMQGYRATFFFLFLTFNDSDLQRMLLYENEEKKLAWLESQASEGVWPQATLEKITRQTQNAK